MSELKLYNCQIGAAGMEQIIQALTGHTGLSVLELSFNTVGSEGARLLGKHTRTVLLSLPPFEYIPFFIYPKNGRCTSHTECSLACLW